MDYTLMEYKLVPTQKCYCALNEHVTLQLLI